MATQNADEATEAELRAKVAQAKAENAKSLADKSAEIAKAAASAAPEEPPDDLTEEEKEQWRKEHAPPEPPDDMSEEDKAQWRKDHETVDSEMAKNLAEAGLVNPDPRPPTAAEKRAAAKAAAAEKKAAAKAKADADKAQPPKQRPPSPLLYRPQRNRQGKECGRKSRRKSCTSVIDPLKVPRVQGSDRIAESD